MHYCALHRDRGFPQNPASFCLHAKCILSLPRFCHVARRPTWQKRKEPSPGGIFLGCWRNPGGRTGKGVFGLAPASPMSTIVLASPRHARFAVRGSGLAAGIVDTVRSAMAPDGRHGNAERPIGPTKALAWIMIPEPRRGPTATDARTCPGARSAGRRPLALDRGRLTHKGPQRIGS